MITGVCLAIGLGIYHILGVGSSFLLVPGRRLSKSFELQHRPMPAVLANERQLVEILNKGGFTFDVCSMRDRFRGTQYLIGVFHWLPSSEQGCRLDIFQKAGDASHYDHYRTDFLESQNDIGVTVSINGDVRVKQLDSNSSP